MKHLDLTHNIKGLKSNVVNNESGADMATQYPDQSGKWSVKLRMFYNNYFPTDKDSYAVRFPVVALAFSLCAIQIFVNLQWKEQREQREYLLWAIVLLLSAATYGLHYGIKIGDRKQFTPWIIFKIIEVITTAISVINSITDGYHMYGSRLLNIILGFGVIAGNLLMLFIIWPRRRNNLEHIQENTYDFLPAPREA